MGWGEGVFILASHNLLSLKEYGLQSILVTTAADALYIFLNTKISLPLQLVCLLEHKRQLATWHLKLDTC